MPRDFTESVAALLLQANQAAYDVRTTKALHHTLNTRWVTMHKAVTTPNVSRSWLRTTIDRFETEVTMALRLVSPTTM